MLSVLIPVYNHTVAELVTALRLQCLPLTAFEILVADDASTIENEDDLACISSLSGVTVIRLSCNIGRSRIRNLLAQKAQFPLLLFIDCDAEVVNDYYITRYIQAAGDFPVVCGGTAYLKIPPAEKELRLRWKYGRLREMRSAEDRLRHPTQNFSSFNFLIHRDVFLAVGFDEQINSYGHEDTLLGIKLAQRGILIGHINAPFLHTGLDRHTVFMDKTESAVRNLWQMYQCQDLADQLVSSVRLLAAYSALHRWRLDGIFAWKFGFMRRPLRWMVIRSKSLILLDLYKLGFLCRISCEK